MSIHDNTPGVVDLERLRASCVVGGLRHCWETYDDDADGNVIRERCEHCGAIEETDFGRLLAEVRRLREAMQGNFDRLESAFGLLHPGELTADEREGVAQGIWFAMQDCQRALGDYDWPSPPGTYAATRTPGAPES